MVSPEPGDPTPIVGASIGFMRGGRLEPRPAHERTAEDDLGGADWENDAALPDLPGLLDRKARFIVPASIFFLVCYFALPALAGYHRDFMETRLGPVKLAYLVALSQFFAAWIVAALYVRAANIFDRDAKAIHDDTHKRPETNQQCPPQYQS
jgi:uncharacterized membrane protein (DUF485 family)